MKLLVLTPCFKVLQDPKTGTSLIGMFQDIQTVVPSDAMVPKDAVMPKEWAVFSLWALERSEIGKKYSMGFEIRWPDGTVFTKNNVPLDVKEGDINEYNNYIVNLLGFPMGQDGKLKITVWIELDGESITDQFDAFIKVKLTKDTAILDEKVQG